MPSLLRLLSLCRVSLRWRKWRRSKWAKNWSLVRLLRSIRLCPRTGQALRREKSAYRAPSPELHRPRRLPRQPRKRQRQRRCRNLEVLRRCELGLVPELVDPALLGLDLGRELGELRQLARRWRMERVRLIILTFLSLLSKRRHTQRKYLHKHRHPGEQSSNETISADHLSRPVSSRPLLPWVRC